MTLLKRILFDINRLLYQSVLLIALLSIPYLLLLAMFGWGNYTVIYWLAMSGAWMWEFALPLFAACSVYFVVMLILFRKPTDSLIRTYAARMVFFSLFTGTILCGTTFVGLWQNGVLGYRQHVVTVQLNSYTYHLQFHSSDSSERYNDRYELYECQFNLFCHVIYTVLRDNGITPPVDQIELVPDDAYNTLVVEINGSTAFTHHL